MRCPQCRQENPARARFCLECGARVPVGCAGCGATLVDGAKFCVECGRPVAAEAPEIAADPGASGVPGAVEAKSPEAYTPRHLVAKILASRSALEGERKPVTVLFCDLVGSTGLAERLGPEGMHGLLNRFFEAALAEVHRYEGTINQFLGDGFMALFGAPLAHEDHARRAVLAALGIRRALEERPLEPEPGRPVRVDVRMGLHTGLVVVGAIGDNLRMDYTAVGDTTHLAARLQQRAEAGAILVSEATARFVEGYVRLEPLGPVPLRGLSEPIAVSRVLGPGPRRSPLEGGEARVLTPLVGRQRELGVLRDLVHQVERGHGQAVGIVGEAGIGKSRLLLELRRVVADRRLGFLEGRCLSFGSAIPYLPVLDLVRARFGIADTDSSEAIASRIRAGLREAGVDADGQGPYLLHLLGVKEETEALEGLGPEVIKTRTFDALHQLCLRGSRLCPLVLTIEDLHWIDRTSEEWLASLVDQMGGAPMLLVATYRPGYRPPWMDRSYATQLSLGRLAADDSLSVVRAILPEAGLADTLGGLILEKAEGNPFFLEELARAVGAPGPHRPELSVPDTVQGVIAARIDRLPETAKRVLQTASVLGREFPRRLLEALWEGPALEAPFRELTRQEFLYARSGADEPTYVFKHALTQEVAEATLLAPRRRELHLRGALALLTLHPERARDLAPLLAHHYVAAEEWALAAESARQAAEAASAVYANREALARYDQAIAAAEHAGLEPAARILLHEARAQVHGVLGAFEPARADLEAALADAERLGDEAVRARALGALGMLWGGHKDYPRGLELCRQAVRAAEGAGDRKGLADALFRVGIMRANLGQVGESRRELERALALFRELGEEAGQARTLDVLGMVAHIAGDLDRSVEASRDATHRLRALGDRETEASSLALLGLGLAYRGEWKESEPRMRDALELSLAIGARSQEAYVHALSGEIVQSYGGYGRALREAWQGLALAREIGHLEWTALALSVVGRTLRHVGDVTGARRLHEEQLATTRELGTVLWIADALGELGEDLVAAGDGAEGRRYLDDAIETAGEALKFAVRALVARADLALREGRIAEALEAARALQGTAPAFRVFVADARRIEGEALAALGRTEEAEALLRRVKADAEALGAGPPCWRACLALDRLLRAEGRPAEAAAERAEALALLEAVAADLPTDDLRRTFEASEPMRLARTGI